MLFYIIQNLYTTFLILCGLHYSDRFFYWCRLFTYIYLFSILDFAIFIKETHLLLLFVWHLLVFISSFHVKRMWFDIKEKNRPNMYYLFCASSLHYCDELFWTQGFPDGVLSNHPCPSVCWSIFEYLRDHPLVFSNFITWS